MSFRFETVEEFRAIGMTHHGPYDGIGATWEKLMPYLEENGLLRPGIKFLSIYFDDASSVPADRLRSAACVTMGGNVTMPLDIEAFTVPGGTFAVQLHKGPYSGLGDAWGRFSEECARRQLRIAKRPCFEIYLNEPASTPPEELLTEMHLPLAESERASTDRV